MSAKPPLSFPGIGRPGSVTAFDDIAARFDTTASVIIHDTHGAITVRDLTFADIHEAYYMSQVLSLRQSIDEGNLPTSDSSVQRLTSCIERFVNLERMTYSMLTRPGAASNKDDAARLWIEQATTRTKKLHVTAMSKPTHKTLSKIDRDRRGASSLSAWLAISKATPTIIETCEKFLAAGMSTDAAVRLRVIMDDLRHYQWVGSPELTKQLRVFNALAFTSLTKNKDLRDTLWKWSIDMMHRDDALPWIILGEWRQKKTAIRQELVSAELARSSGAAETLEQAGKMAKVQQMIDSGFQQMKATENSMRKRWAAMEYECTLDQSKSRAFLRAIQGEIGSIEEFRKSALEFVQKYLSAETGDPANLLKSEQGLIAAMETLGSDGEEKIEWIENLSSRADVLRKSFVELLQHLTDPSSVILKSLTITSDDIMGLRIRGAFRREIELVFSAAQSGQIAEHGERVKRTLIDYRSHDPYAEVDSLDSFQRVLEDERERRVREHARNVSVMETAERDASADPIAAQRMTLERKSPEMPELQESDDESKEDSTASEGLEHSEPRLTYHLPELPELPPLEAAPSGSWAEEVEEEEARNRPTSRPQWSRSVDRGYPKWTDLFNGPTRVSKSQRLYYGEPVTIFRTRRTIGSVSGCS